MFPDGLVVWIAAVGADDEPLLTGEIKGGGDVEGREVVVGGEGEGEVEGEGRTVVVTEQSTGQEIAVSVGSQIPSPQNKRLVTVGDRDGLVVVVVVVVVDGSLLTDTTTVG